MWRKWILIFSLTTHAWGYQLTSDFMNGFYWASLPVNIMVVESNPSRKELLENLAQTAISEWETRSGFTLWSFLRTGTTNIIRWSTNFAAETRMDPSNVLAVAIRYTNGPYFAKTEIIINGNHVLNQNQTYLRTTLTHELGHTMGLDHSDVEEAVMAPTLQAFYSGLHQDDVQGMQAAYTETEYRQLTRYVSPLAYNKETQTNQPLSCGTVGVANQSGQVSYQGLFSLLTGLLIAFVRKALQWFKSLF
jgi:hypothetical protein